MLIEYQFKFERNGLTITQRVEPEDSESQAAEGVLAEENSLKASFQESQKASAAMTAQSGGGGPVKKPGGGGGGPVKKPGGGGSGPTGFGTAQITIIGPFIMCCPSDDPKKENKG